MMMNCLTVLRGQGTRAVTLLDNMRCDMQENMKFVKTNDENVAEELWRAGFTELTKEGDKWVFLNDAKTINFSADKPVCYTDMLTF